MKLKNWQDDKKTNLANELKAKLLKRDEEHIKAKQVLEELKIYDYIVRGDDTEHRTKSLQEAKNLAKSINGKVWWCVEGDVVGLVE